MKNREFDAVAEELENVTVILKNLAKRVKELEKAKEELAAEVISTPESKKFKVKSSGVIKDYRVIALSENAKKYIETKYPCDQVHFAPSEGELMQISETDEGLIKADLPIEKYAVKQEETSSISSSAEDFFNSIENNSSKEMDLDVTKVKRGIKAKPKAIKLKDVVVDHARGLSRLNGIFEAISTKKDDFDFEEEVVKVQKTTYEDRALSIDDELAAALSVQTGSLETKNKPKNDILDELSSLAVEEDEDFSPFAETMAIKF